MALDEATRLRMQMDLDAAPPSPDPQAVPDAQGVSESQFRQQTPAEKTDDAKVTPGFMDSLKTIADGSMRGSLMWTGRLLSFAEGKTTGTNYVQNAVDHWDKAVNDDATKFHGAGFLSGLGSLLPELATTAPIGPALGATSKIANAVGKAFPYGSQRLAQYATSAAGGGAVLGGMEGLRSETSDSPTADQPFNTGAANEALHSAGTYIAPMAGTLLGNYAERASKLGEARKVIPSMTNRQMHTAEVGTDGVTKMTPGGWIKSLMFDSISNQVGAGYSARQQESVGKDIAKYINNLSGNIVAKYKTDYLDEAGKQFQKTMAGMNLTKNEMYANVGLKNYKVGNPAAIIKEDVMPAIQVLDKYKSIPSASETVTMLQDAISKKGNMTLEDVKNIKSLIGKAEINARGMDTGGIGNNIADEIKVIKESLSSKIQNGLADGSPNSFLAAKAQKDYAAANQYNANLKSFEAESRRIKESLYDDVAARGVVKSMTSEAEAISKSATLGVMNKEGLAATTATQLAGALEAAKFPTGRAVDIGRFIELTGPNTVVGKLMGSTPDKLGDTHKAFIGLTNLLRSVQETGSHKMSKYLLAAGGVGALGVIGNAYHEDNTFWGGVVPTGAAVISYLAMAGFANHSPVKTMLNHFTKNLSPSTKEHLMNKAQQMLVQGGWFMNDEGILDFDGTPKKKTGVKK